MFYCPNDKNELKSVAFKSVNVLECNLCKGLFFDREELTKAKNNTDNDLRWLNFDLFSEKDHKYNDHPSSKKCPKDNTEMSSLKYQHSTVLIDKCNTCKGVWLDHGEFQKIINYLEKIVVSESAKGYEKETIKKFLELGTDHEDKISEFKDLLVLTKLLEERFIIEHPSLEETIRAITVNTPPGL